MLIGQESNLEINPTLHYDPMIQILDKCSKAFEKFQF